MSLEDDAELRDVWPGALSDEEEALWLALPEARKATALLRLRAVLGLYPPDGSDPVHSSMAAAAEAAGTGVSTFYAIARRWRTRPSLAALGVHAASDGPGTGMEESARAELERRVRDMLAEEPDLSVAEIRERLGAATAVEASFATVRRIAQRVLRGLPPRRRFGEEIVFDSAGLDLGAEQGSQPTVMRLNAVLDVGTGLVLGWDIEPQSELFTSYGIAVRRAWPRNDWERHVARHQGHALSDFDLSEVSAFCGTPRLHVNVLPGIKAELAEPGDAVLFENPLSGASLVSALGERLGPVWIGKGTREPGRSFRTGRIEAMPAFGSGVERLVHRAVSDHNLERLALVPRTASREEARALADEIGARAARIFN